MGRRSVERDKEQVKQHLDALEKLVSSRISSTHALISPAKIADYTSSRPKSEIRKSKSRRESHHQPLHERELDSPRTRSRSKSLSPRPSILKRTPSKLRRESMRESMRESPRSISVSREAQITKKKHEVKNEYKPTDYKKKMKRDPTSMTSHSWLNRAKLLSQSPSERRKSEPVPKWMKMTKRVPNISSDSTPKASRSKSKSNLKSNSKSSSKSRRRHSHNPSKYDIPKRDTKWYSEVIEAEKAEALRRENKVIRDRSRPHVVSREISLPPESSITSPRNRSISTMSPSLSTEYGGDHITSLQEQNKRLIEQLGISQKSYQVLMMEVTALKAQESSKMTSLEEEVSRLKTSLHKVKDEKHEAMMENDRVTRDRDMLKSKVHALKKELSHTQDQIKRVQQQREQGELDKKTTEQLQYLTRRSSVGGPVSFSTPNIRRSSTFTNSSAEKSWLAKAGSKAQVSRVLGEDIGTVSPRTRAIIEAVHKKPDSQNSNRSNSSADSADQRRRRLVDKLLDLQKEREPRTDVLKQNEIRNINSRDHAPGPTVISKDSRFGIQSLHSEPTLDRAPAIIQSRPASPRYDVQRTYERPQKIIEPPKKVRFEADLGQKYVELKYKYEDALSFLRQIGAADLKTSDELQH